MSLPQRFNDSEYKNWLKCVDALIILKEGLHPFIDTGVNKLHKDVKQKVIIFLGGSNGAIQCNSCSSKGIFRKRATGQNLASWMIHCPNNICDVWLDEILAVHNERDKQSINWMNSDITKWETEPYEIAKVFMPKGLDMKTNLPEELDILAVLSLLKYCTCFSNYVPNAQLLTDLIDVRNTLFHTGSFKVPDAQRDKWIDMMSQLVMDLNLPGNIHTNLCMLKTEAISIKFQEIETTALMKSVTELQYDIEVVRNEMDCLKEIQIQLSKQTQNIEEKADNTGIRTETLEEDMIDVKSRLRELKQVSDKIGVFLETNNIDDEAILHAVASNKKNIIELSCRQCEVEKNILDIKYELSSVKEEVDKTKKENNQQLEEVKVKVEKNKREVNNFKRKGHLTCRAIWNLLTWFICSVTAIIAIMRIPFCLTRLKPLLGDRVNWMIATMIGLGILGIYCIAMNCSISIYKNGRKSQRLFIRCCSLLAGFLLWIAVAICWGLTPHNFIQNGPIDYKEFMDNEAGNVLTEKIQRTYTGCFPACDSFSDALDNFQIQYQCCGVNHYTDFHNARNWNRTSVNPNETMMIPPSCCKMKKTDQGTPEPRSATCTVDGSESNKDKPCLDDIKMEYNAEATRVIYLLLLQTWVFCILIYYRTSLIPKLIYGCAMLFTHEIHEGRLHCCSNQREDDQTMSGH